MAYFYQYKQGEEYTPQALSGRKVCHVEPFAKRVKYLYWNYQKLYPSCHPQPLISG
ncbi:hypothetical protein [Helicobacter marmotae]|uniref:hypothetical protein n=1 Tax=Helicobacter marmotae TaxID=152490 RepID=UPI0014738D1F|nr:hypothetical protein [Helicobacter marmotae]